jgi:hypothetical protein
MPATRRVTASVVIVGGVVALAAIILTAQVERCRDGSGWLSQVAEALPDFDRAWALLALALAAAISCGIAGLVIGVSTDVRHGIVATTGLVAIATGAALLGRAVGSAVAGCEVGSADEVGDLVIPIGVASLAGAVVGCAIGLAVATIIPRRP